MQKRRHIQHILVRSIALTVFATLAVAIVVSVGVLSDQSRRQVSEVLSQSLDDTLSSSDSAVYWMVMDAAYNALYDGDGKFAPNDAVLHDLVESKALTSLDVLDKDGTIVHSSDKGRVGLSYYDDQQTKAYVEKVKRDSIKQPKRDSELIEHVESWPLYDNKPYHLVSDVIYLSNTEDYNVAVMGMSDGAFNVERTINITTETRYRRVGEHGYMLFCNSDLIVMSSALPDYFGQKPLLSHDIGQVCDEDLVVKENLFGENAYVRARRVAFPYETESCSYLLAAYMEGDAQAATTKTLILLVAFCAILFVALLVLISRQMKHHVVDRVAAVNTTLEVITSGALSERVDVADSIEFENLSRGINTTVAKLEDLIHQEATRLDEELALARIIQKTALPSVFPPFPERRDFGLFASMDAAKEVGGDFYDFFLVSDDEIAVIVADVSDKGIPAAMFMMRTKAAIKALAVSGLPVDEVISHANNDLVQDNEAGMFVTVWLGILNLRTGLLEYVHAGHTCPALLTADGVTYVQKKRNFIVGARAGMTYDRQELQLGPGDAVFLYSDGVTEAFSANDDIYGSERLADVLWQASAEADATDPGRYCEEICTKVKQDVDAFSAGIEQSDDITTLCIRFEGQGEQ